MQIASMTWLCAGLLLSAACGGSDSGDLTPAMAAQVGRPTATAGRAGSLERPLSEIASLTFRGGYMFAVRRDGKVLGWGACTPGFLSVARYLATIGEVVSLTTVADTSPTDSCKVCSAIACGVGKDGKLRCDAIDHTLPEDPELAKITGKIVSAGVGRRNACVVVEDGTPHCWGESAELSAVSRLSGKAQEVVVGFDHACARLEDGTVWCWGKNGSGQLGAGRVKQSGSVPAVAVQVMGVTNAKTLSVAGDSTCAIVADGGVICWGGDLSSDDELPLRVAGLENVVQYLPSYGCALFADGTAACRKAGSDAWTKLRGVNNAVSLAMGTTSCFVGKDGTVQCWGPNTYDGLCTKPGTNWETPMPIRCAIDTLP